MAYSIERIPERISIGRETETGVTDVRIDCGAWVDKWPGMALHAIYTPEGGAPYILQTETDGGVLVWHVTDADTATPGTGRMEIVGEMDGRRKVSATVKVYVAARMSGTVGEPPEAAKPWADRVVEAAGRVTGMQVQAETLAAGSGATAAWDGEQGLLTIGVPKGEKGEKGEPGKDAVVDATLTQSGQAADAKVTGDALALKLTEPSTGLAVGKYFRIAAIDESGHAVLEAVDAAQIGVQDVQVAGASVVTDGMANVKLYDKSFGMNDSGIFLRNANNNQITARSANVSVSCTNIDYAVKAAMCDGKGAAWTSEEQAAARERIGLPGDYELIETFTIDEEANIIRDKEPDGTLYNFKSVIIFGETPVISKTYYVVFLVNGLWLASVHCNKTGNKYYFCVRASAEGGRLFSKMTYATSRDAISATYSRNVHSHGWYAGKAISKFTTNEVLPAGTVITIYGVRA